MQVPERPAVVGMALSWVEQSHGWANDWQTLGPQRNERRHRILPRTETQIICTIRGRRVTMPGACTGYSEPAGESGASQEVARCA